MSNRNINLKRWVEKLNNKPHIRDVNPIISALKICDLDANDPDAKIRASDPRYNTAKTLSRYKFDQNIIAAAIIYEHFKSNINDLNKYYDLLDNDTINLINGAYKMNLVDKHLTSNKKTSLNSENFYKLLISILDDPKIAVIKLVEQIVLLNTMLASNQFDHTHANNIKNVYVPLASRLGMGQIKSELEDLSFQILQPSAFKKIRDNFDASQNELIIFINKKIKFIKTQLRQLKIKNFEAYGRTKHIYSIYSKMLRKNVPFDQIYDLIAIRLHVPTIRNCYEVLSAITQMWPSTPDEFDDYIANPKANGYKSLHAALTDENNKIFEVQIRTYQMHEESEYGIAAHWHYKQGGIRNTIADQKANWLRQVLSWQKHLTNDEQNATPTFQDDRVYIFTPTGDVINLPSGSTPLDFAYNVHTDIGHKCNGAKRNGNIIPLNYQLQTGDQIQILTSKSHTPNKNWLVPQNGYITTSKARSKINSWFNTQNKLSYKNAGKELLEKHAKKYHAKDLHLDKIAKHFNFKTIDRLLISIGRGDTTPQFIFENFMNKSLSKEKTKNIAENPLYSLRSSKPSSVNLLGLNDILTHTAKCCNPQKGDQIIGYVSRRYGVYIHKADCKNIITKSVEQQQRMLPVSWGSDPSRITSISLEIKSKNKKNMINDITSVLSAHCKTILSITTQHIKDQVIIFNVYAEIANLDKVDPLIIDISKVEGTISTNLLSTKK